jgi:uncharacterized protein with PIN domain
VRDVKDTIFEARDSKIFSWRAFGTSMYFMQARFRPVNKRLLQSYFNEFIIHIFYISSTIRRAAMRAAVRLKVPLHSVPSFLFLPL